MRAILILLAATLAGACTSGTSTGPDNAAFVGTWGQRDAPMAIVVTLQVNGASVTGNGTYAKDGGGSGTLSLTGSISGDSIRLDMTFDSSAIAQFSGTLANNSSQLTGSLHFGSSASLTAATPTTFDKR